MPLREMNFHCRKLILRFSFSYGRWIGDDPIGPIEFQITLVGFHTSSIDGTPLGA